MDGKYVFVDSQALADIESIKSAFSEFDLSDSDVVSCALRFWLQSEVLSSGYLIDPTN